MIAAGTEACSLYILRLEDLYEMTSLCDVWCVATRLHAQYLPQGKEKLLLRDILCLKRRSCLPPPALFSDS